MAPGMLPMPPSTAAVKAFRPGMKPVYGLTRLYWIPNSTPAAPPMAPPMRNVSEMMPLRSEHRGGEGLQAGNEARVRVDQAVLDPEQHAGGAAHGAADEERQRDDAVAIGAPRR